MLLAGVVAALASGCGGGSGVQDGASVNVYVSVPLSGPQAAAGRASCAAAKAAAAGGGARAGDVRVRVACLDDSDGSARWQLAAVGANARGAAADTATVAYIGELDPAASRFSETILESAEIAQVPAADGGAAMKRVLAAIGEAEGDSELRAAVLAAIEAGEGAAG